MLSPAIAVVLALCGSLSVVGHILGLVFTGVLALVIRNLWAFVG